MSVIVNVLTGCELTFSTLILNRTLSPGTNPVLSKLNLNPIPEDQQQSHPMNVELDEFHLLTVTARPACPNRFKSRNPFTVK